jgi:ribosome biogenesis GTPase / thiamine phosphate phosphatase
VVEEYYDEEEYFPEVRKEQRLERKIASRTDKSKYKKTDRDKKRKAQQRDAIKERPSGEVMKGRVIAITGQGSVVDYNGKDIHCVLRGAFKKERTETKNIIAVGDVVHFSTTAEGEGVISYVEERYSILSRADHLSQRKQQIIAANIDLVLITTSVISPPLKPHLIDRYIIATRKGNMNPVIIINKVDLFDDENVSEEERAKEKKLCDELVAIYSSIDIPVVRLSAERKEGMDELEKIMQGKASVFAGQSGTGKSSLINVMMDLDLETAPVMKKIKKGTHTTTTSRLIPLACEGWCVDTPGIRSFGLWDLKKEDVEGYYDEILEYGAGCKFDNCTHIHEPGCAVQQAVEDGNISSLRFKSYQTLIKSVSEKYRPR